MSEKIVYIVDDEPKVLDLIKELTDSAGLNSEAYSNPLEFIESCSPSHKGCLVLDMKMPEMNGLELQKEMNKKGCMLPIIFITGYGNVAMAVEAMKAGAIDFLEKPYSGESLLESIHCAFDSYKKSMRSTFVDGSTDNRISTLTPRENEVMKMLADSMSNKAIARMLDISPRTVEVHRQHIMKKLNIKSVLELSKVIE
ncbi:MAG: response regulator transcription factor [Sulfuriflexus sp.]|nr:response regulator transcription factor [Sulfuriflexus sp.]